MYTVVVSKVSSDERFEALASTPKKAFAEIAGKYPKVERNNYMVRITDPTIQYEMFQDFIAFGETPKIAFDKALNDLRWVKSIYKAKHYFKITGMHGFICNTNSYEEAAHLNKQGFCIEIEEV